MPKYTVPLFTSSVFTAQSLAKVAWSNSEPVIENTAVPDALGGPPAGATHRPAGTRLGSSSDSAAPTTHSADVTRKISWYSVVSASRRARL